MTSAFSLIEIILIFIGLLYISTPWMFWSLLILYFMVQSAYKKKYYKDDEEF